tara:strand:+ start:152 stop:907 length:756 start_codon:yes stop_codon:yes gene_type:complete
MKTPIEIGNSYKPKKLLPYTSNDKDVWDVLKLANPDPYNNTHIQLLYTGDSIKPGEAGHEYTSGWNREHCWPKSLGGGMNTSSPGIGTDLHNLFCADQSMNSTRSNKAYGVGIKSVIDNSPAPKYDGITDCKSDVGYFEPPDDVKGIVARAVFYMACVYADVPYNLRLCRGQTPDGANTMPNLDLLLEWNKNHTVTASDRHRNKVIETYQGNNNPFVSDSTLANRVSWDTHGMHVHADTYMPTPSLSFCAK